jgi:hypothetical protein
MFKKIDQSIPKNKLRLVLDAVPIYDLEFDNIDIVQMPCTWFTKRPFRKSMPGTTIDRKDFIFIIGKQKPHRDLLWNSIQQNNLLDYSINKYQRIEIPDAAKGGHWIGNIQHHNEFIGPFVPPMDIYGNANFELAVETYSHSFYYTTEKTLKPIVCKLPFLIMSAPGYLEYLKSMGFETFGSVIDESYDQESDIEKRIALISKEIAHILAHGSQKFYNDTKHICQHNYNNWARIHGGWNHTMDEFLLDLLDL